LLGSDRYITIVLILDSEGEILNVASRRSVLPSEQALHLSMAPWERSHREHTLCYSSLYLSQKDEIPRVAMSLPLVDMNAIHFGSLTAEVQLRTLQKVFDDYAHKSGEGVFLFDKSGAPILKASAAGEKEAGSLSRILKNRIESRDEQIRERSSWQSEFELGGRKALAVFYPYSSFGWIGATVSKEDYRGLLSFPYNMLFSGTAILIIISLAGALILARPGKGKKPDRT
jgi:hypothetical protein